MKIAPWLDCSTWNMEEHLAMARGVCFGKSAPSAPPAPDPNAVANAQGAANVNTAVAQSALNNVNQVTPYGSSTFSQTGTTTTPAGDQIPTYTQTVSLPADTQAALQNQQALQKTLSGYGTDIAKNIQTGNLDLSKLPAFQSSVPLSSLPQVNTDFSGAQKQAQEAAFNQAYSLLKPQQDYESQQLQSQLANAGIPPSSPAYKDAMNRLDTQHEAVNNNLAQGAVATGNAQQQALFGQGLAANQNAYGQQLTNVNLSNAARNQGITEQQLLMSTPINELAALLQGAPAIGQPNVASPAQTRISPTDVTGAYALNQGAQNVAYQGGLNTANAGNSAAAGLLGSGIGAAALLF